ncbi:hypothetical protein KAU33_11845, partial [Candidatus Dependentiae bacterium]|nr:hypothetical protein [Candidatus Dependentiae bacterium]
FHKTKEKIYFKLDKSIEKIIKKEKYKESIKIGLNVALGKKMLHLMYKNQNWFKRNIKFIITKSSWHLIMESFLFFNNYAIKDHYLLLRKYELYKKSIKKPFEEKSSNKRLVHQICIGYLEGDEDISKEESTIYYLLKHGNPQHIEEIVNHFWSLWDRDKNSSVYEMIKPLWKRLLKKGKDPKYVESIQNIFFWLSLYCYASEDNKIDDEINELLLESINYLKEDFDQIQLLDYFEYIIGKQPEKVGEYILKLAEKDRLVFWEQERLVVLIDKLYGQGSSCEKCEELADAICNIYGEKGLYFLEKTYFDNMDNEEKKSNNE